MFEKLTRKWPFLTTVYVSILVLVHESEPNQPCPINHITRLFVMWWVLLSLGLKKAGKKGSARRNAKIPVP